MAETTDDARARPAVDMSDGSASLSHDALDRRSIQFSHALRRAGLRPGERVAILLENCIEWIVAMWGTRRAGMLYVPVNWHLKPDEVRYVLDNSDARAIVTSAALRDLAATASGGLSGIVLRLAVGGGGARFDDWDAALDREPDVPVPDERDGGAMPYSSGTTGAPKSILRLPDGAPFRTPNSLDTLLTGLYAIDAATIYLIPAPMYHSAPVGFANTVLLAGGTIVLMPRFEPEAALAAIARHRVTHAQFVPTHFVRMLQLEPAVRARHDLSSLTTAIHAAAPCPPHVKQAMIEWLGEIVHEYYAGSERCGFTAITAREWLQRPGSVGRSVTGAIHVRDPDTGAELPPGKIGAIWFENAVPFAYHKDAAKTAATIDANGWGTLGDIGHVDGDGYLYLADRRSDLILSGGVNIYPQEVENALIRHPAVNDAAVIGVADAEFGQRVEAVIELRPGEAVSEAELIAWARAEVAHFKAPRRIRFVDALPRLPNGKLLRRRLIEEEAASE